MERHILFDISRDIPTPMNNFNLKIKSAENLIGVLGQNSRRNATIFCTFLLTNHERVVS